MNYQLFFEPSAEEDYRDAFYWYEDQYLGLGSDFEENVDECLLNILSSPEAYSPVGKRFRQAKIKNSHTLLYIVLKRNR